MPNSPLRDIKTGKDYSDKIMNGEVFLVFAITGCEACKKELQFFSQTESNFNSKIDVIAVMFQDEQIVKDYVEQNEVKIPVLVDKDGKLFQELNLKYFPSNFKLANGEIKQASFGLPRDINDLINQAEY
ncbi:MAG: peroxiredoxin family protein [Aridibacter sp.]